MNNIINIVIAVLLSLICFASLYVNIHILLILLLIIVLLINIYNIILFGMDIKYNNRFILLLYIFAVWLLCSFFSENNSDFYSLAYLGIAMFISIIINQINGWEKIYINYIWIICFIYTFMTFLQFIYPEIIALLVSRLLKYEDFLVNIGMLNWGAYAGITNQTGINGYYISTFIIITYNYLISLSFNKMMREKPQIIYKILLRMLVVFGLFALILTKKRLFFVVIFIEILFITYLNDKKSIKYRVASLIITILIISLLIYLFSLYIPNVKEFFIRIFEGNVDSDYTSGRLQLWRDSLSLFLERPLFGWGWFSSIKFIKQSGSPQVPHNVFIQMLFEVGIVGIIPYIILIIYCIKKVLIIVKSNSENVDVLIIVCIQFLFIFWNFTGNPVWDIYPFIQFLFSFTILDRYITKKIIL